LKNLKERLKGINFSGIFIRINQIGPQHKP
jgi:hypothetical protein